MKQIWSNYSYSPTTNVLTLTGLNIDRDQLLLVAAPERGRIMYNFADSSVTASAFTSGANTALTLVATTAGLTTTAALVIYYDDQLQSTSVSISNLPSTQTIAGTVTVSVLPSLQSSTDFASAGEDIAAGINAYGTIPIAADWQNAVQGIQNLPVNITAGTSRIGVVTIGGGTVTIGAGTAQIGSVTASISNSVTISSLPAISGTVTANNSTLTNVLQYDGSHYFLKVGGVATTGGTSFPVYVAGTVTVGNSVTISSLPSLVAGTANIGVVTIGNIRRAGDGALTQLTTEVGSGALQTVIGSGTSQIGSVTVSNFGIFSSDEGGVQPDIAIQLGFSTETAPGEDYVRVAPSNPLPVTASGTVTANSSNGSLTTRFGSVTTANTAFATSAVTNTNRKYLLIQNITTASNVITVGIGYTPTTTQGIQLFAGAGLTFEGSYIPTGAVNLLSSVTASCYTILEA